MLSKEAMLIESIKEESSREGDCFEIYRKRSEEALNYFFMEEKEKIAPKALPQPRAFHSLKEAFSSRRVVGSLCLTGEPDLPLTTLGRLKGLKELSLSGNDLAALPEELFELSELEELDICCNPLSEIPEEIGRLRSLKVFKYLSFDSQLGSYYEGMIDALPDSFARLKSLESLHLVGQSFHHFPRQILELKNLACLCLDDNSIGTIPAEICRLSGLERLFAASNRLTALPESIGELTGLTLLDLHSNPLTGLPNSICSLTALESLNLAGTELEELPENIGRLTKLKRLVLPSGIKALPASLASCPELKIITVEDGLERMKGLASEVGLDVEIAAP